MDASGFAGKANSFCCGLGAEPGRGFLLMAYADVENLVSGSLFELVLGIDDDGTTTSTTSTSTTPGPGKGIPQASRWQRFPRIVFVRAINLFSSPSDEEERICLVEIADIRYWLKKSFINERYNFRCLSGSDKGYWNDTLYRAEGTTTSSTEAPSTTTTSTTVCPSPIVTCGNWTWRTMLDDIWQHLPSQYANVAPHLPDDFSTMASTPYPQRWDRDWFTSPDRFSYLGMSALDAYVDALKHFGAVLSYSPVEDLFRVFVVGDGVSASEQGTHLTQDVAVGKRSVIPEKVYVVYPAIYKDRTNESFYTHSNFVDEFTFQDYLDITGDVSGTYVAAPETIEILYGDTDAIYAASVTQTCSTLSSPRPTPQSDGTTTLAPTNVAVINTRTKALGFRYFSAAIAVAQTNYVSNAVSEGVFAAYPNGLRQRICWYDIGNGFFTKYENLIDPNEFFRKYSTVPERDGCCCPDVPTTTASPCPTTPPPDPATCATCCSDTANERVGYLQGRANVPTLTHTRTGLTYPQVTFSTCGSDAVADNYVKYFSTQNGTQANISFGTMDGGITKWNGSTSDVDYDNLSASEKSTIRSCAFGGYRVSFAGVCADWAVIPSPPLTERRIYAELIVNVDSVLYGSTSACGSSLSVIGSLVYDSGIADWKYEVPAWAPASIEFECCASGGDPTTTTTTTPSPCNGFDVWQTQVIEGVGLGWVKIEDGGPGCSGVCDGGLQCYSLPPTESPVVQGAYATSGCGCNTATTTTTTTTTTTVEPTTTTTTTTFSP